MMIQLLVALATALATWTLGWWGVAVVAVAAGALARAGGSRPWLVALGATEGWAILLLFDVASGPFARVASTVSGAMKIPSAGLLVATLLFPALIGWSGATLGAAGRSATR
jgi:hypothetical protein